MILISSDNRIERFNRTHRRLSTGRQMDRIGGRERNRYAQPLCIPTWGWLDGGASWASTELELESKN